MSDPTPCPSCAEGICQEGIRLGGIVGLFLTQRKWRKAPELPSGEEAFFHHQRRIFAYAQAIHANDGKEVPSPGVYITEDQVLLAHPEVLEHRFNVRPISLKEAQARGITHAFPTCEVNAGTTSIPVEDPRG